MNGTQACVGAVLLAGSGAILTATGSPGGQVLVAAGALALVLAVAQSLRRRAEGRAV